MVQTRICDKDGNGLTYHINDKNLLYLCVGDLDDGDYYHIGYITLDQDDLKALIKALKTELKNMQENG